jgi:3-deoxy-D-manno-octulosonic-acid transferase/heptosyltransferase-1
MKILIIKLSAIGDVIHTLPALNVLRKQYPDAHITWVVEEAAAALVEGHEALDRVMVSGRKRWARGILKGPDRLRNGAQLFRFIQTLREESYDLVIDFQQLLKSGVLAGLARGKIKAGFDRGMEHMEHSHLFLNRRVPPISMEIHALRRNLMLLESLGMSSQDVVYHLPISHMDRKKAADLMAGHGMDSARPFAAINPVALWETKLWSNLKFAELADMLTRDFGLNLIFTGGPADSAVIQDILSSMKTRTAADLSGKTSLKELGAIYERAAFVVSTDTGPMHLAAAVGTPVAALFGPTAPWRTGPYGPGHQVIRLGLPCSPCFKRRCYKNRECMERILVENVLDKIQRLMPPKYH